MSVSFGGMELVVLASLLGLAAIPILAIALFVAMSRASARQRDANAH